MKTRRWVGWAVLIVLLASALPAMAGFGTTAYHYLYGTGARGSWTYRYNGKYYNRINFYVPANAASLKVETGLDGHGGYGDCDLYVFYQSTSNLRGKSEYNSYKERVTLSNPAAGNYYIYLRTYNPYRTCVKIVCTQKSATTSWRTDMLNRVNNYRRQSGRAALAMNSKLQTAAQNYASDQAGKSYYGGSNHVGSTSANWTMAKRVSATGYRWAALGYDKITLCENIAAGYTTVSAVMTGWWQSPGHKRNILNPYVTQAGFGYAYNANDRYYIQGYPARTRWVQNFGRPQ